MQSKFSKASKTVTRMLSEGRITDLANYIKSGNSIDNLFLMPVADELARNGVSVKMLTDKGSIVSFNDLLKNLENESLCKALDRSLLKHYGFVIERTLKLWRDDRLDNICSSLNANLDERAVTHLMRQWNNKISSGRSPFIAYVDKCIIRHVDVFTTSIKKGVCTNGVSNEQLQYYTNHLEDKLLDVWERSPGNFKEIKSHLAEVLKDILLEDAKAGKLGEVLQSEVSDKFRETLINHITILDDLARYPALNEKFKAIFIAKQQGQVRKDVTFEAIAEIVNNYSRFDKKVMADVNTLFRDEVIPFIIANKHIPINLRRAAVNTVIRDQRNNAINLVIGTYVTELLNSTIAAMVSEDIRQDQGPFRGVVEQIIRQAVYGFKRNAADICAIMPNTPELFADIHRVMLLLEESIDQHKASDARIRLLERSMFELIQANNQLRAESRAHSAAPDVATAPPAAAVFGTAPVTQGSRGLLGFFDRTTASADSTSKTGPTLPQSNKP